MLKKIISIKNVGKFTNYQAQGKVDLSKMALIYAENGRGKTTLSAILRSLGTNRAEYILGRRSLGVPDDEDITISILTDTGVAQFNSETTNEWDRIVKDIEIFDSLFVNENVFSGDYVDIEHQRHLYLFVVGEESVERAKKIDEIDQKIRDLNTRIREQETEVKNLIQGGLAISAFLGLPEDLMARSKLEDKEKQLRDLGEAVEIARRPMLKLVQLPILDRKTLEDNLSRTIETTSADAEMRTLEHIHKYEMSDGETWVRQGIEHIHDETCPLCGQNIGTVEIIRLFRNYFDKAYANLKKDLANARAKYDHTFSELKFRDLQKDILENGTHFEFWKDFVEIENPPSLSIETIQKTWDQLRSILLNTLDKKLQSPIEIITVGASLENAWLEYEAALNLVRAYNETDEQVNGFIQKVKKKTAQTNEGALKDEILRLQNQIIRHSPAGKSECDKYQNLTTEKENLDKKKKDERKKLDSETASTFDIYQERINYHLEKIDASFRIQETKPNFKGGKASSSYSLVLNGTSIEIGDRELDKPGFSNTLSDGDKNTLAFALFLAKLDKDPNLCEKIIVFDDPANSLDRHRKSYTIEQIEKISKTLKQLIVLSHDPYFLRELWTKFDRSNTTTLWISRSGNASQIEQWKIEEETDTDYIRNYRQLVEYLETGNGTFEHMRSVARCIRPTLEGYLRQKYPLDFLVNEWLNEFIKKVRVSSESNRLNPMNRIIDEIESISKYSSKYHHKQNLNYDTEPIDDATLQSYINRTMKIIHA